MNHSVVRFPVKCPLCGQESLTGSGLNTIVETLATDRPLKLSADCAYHRVVWVANEIERHQIHDYTEAVHFCADFWAGAPHPPRCAPAILMVNP
jgi:hypothetical protein